jgi:hypothetical protein
MRKCESSWSHITSRATPFTTGNWIEQHVQSTVQETSNTNINDAIIHIQICQRALEKWQVEIKSRLVSTLSILQRETG